MSTPKMNGVIEQSGVIPCRVRRGKVEVALVTTSNSARWTIPKGHIEEGLSAQESAAKESLEEAGLIGSVHPRQICIYSYQKRGLIRQVRVYLMLVTRELNDWPEMHVRRRKWQSIERAMMCVQNDSLRSGFRRAERLLLGVSLAAAA